MSKLPISYQTFLGRTNFARGGPILPVILVHWTIFTRTIIPMTGLLTIGEGSFRFLWEARPNCRSTTGWISWASQVVQTNQYSTSPCSPEAVCCETDHRQWSLTLSLMSTTKTNRTREEVSIKHTPSGRSWTSLVLRSTTIVCNLTMQGLRGDRPPLCDNHRHYCPSIVWWIACQYTTPTHSVDNMVATHSSLSQRRSSVMLII